MSDPILQDIAAQMSRMNTEIERAKTLISIAEEAGEDMTANKARLRDAEVRRNKWRDTLQAKGYAV